ncbi:sialidase family protein [Streptomyces sp. NPDC001795]|uniref:sialidase family protein n=1 Tax=Streptomyces sp. NPDC001795 TaxID=3154525 RepID=UPI00331ADB5C
MRPRVPLFPAAVVLLAAVIGAVPATAGGGNGPLRKVSSGDPYAGCTLGATPKGVNYAGSEVEPYIAVDPRDPRRVVTVFQQDRWSDGGARGLVASWTRNGRTYHETPLPFSAYAPGGAPYGRASDPWVSTGPDGVVYAGGVGFDADRVRNAVLAAASYDGGRTWRNLTATQTDDDPAFFNDKPTITADPKRHGTAYQVWNRFDFAPTDPGSRTESAGYIAVTHDGGRTWGPARPITETAANTVAAFLQLVVDPRSGTLYSFFNASVLGTDSVTAHYSVVKSTDGGSTWSAPTVVAQDTSVPEVDPNDPAKALRAGAGVPSPAIDPRTGTLYLAYEGSDFSGGAYNSVQLVRSIDGGRTWSSPQLISRKGTPAFSPSIAVEPRGAVALTYYDLRFLKPGDTAALPTAYWLTSLPGGDARRRTERRGSRVFDWLQAPFSDGYFLGDYQGLASTGHRGVQPVLTETNSGAPRNPTDEYTGLLRLPDLGGAHPWRAQLPAPLAHKGLSHQRPHPLARVLAERHVNPARR